MTVKNNCNIQKGTFMKKQLLLSLAVLSSLGTINADGLLSRLAGFLNIRSQKLTFDRKLMNREDGEACKEMLGDSKPNPWPGQNAFLSQLKHLQKSLNPLRCRCRLTCDFCQHSYSRATYTYKDELAGNASWPEILGDHFIPQHNVQPSEEFYHYVMDADARKRYIAAYDILFR